MSYHSTKFRNDEGKEPLKVQELAGDTPIGGRGFSETLLERVERGQPGPATV